MNKIEKLINQATSKHKDSDIYVGFSGGVDSCVLLYALKKLNFNIKAIHVNHGIQDDSLMFENFAINFCNTHNIPLINFKGTVVANKNGGIEQAAREFRFSCFEKVCNNGLIILGHHLNDQVETILFRAIRGTGIGGLSAMKKESKRNNNIILRPLLDIHKKDIIEYATFNKINWVEDKTNEDNKYSRNILRNEIIPKLTTIHPAANNNIFNLAEHAREQMELVDILAKIDFEAISENNKINISKLITLTNPPRIKNVIRYWLQKNDFILNDKKNIAGILNILNNEKSIQLSNKIFIHNWKNFLWLESKKPEFKNSIAATDHIEANGWELSISNFSQNGLKWKPSNLKEFIKLTQKNKQISLSEFFRQNNIPPWERQAIPTLNDDEGYLWAPGIPPSDRLKKYSIQSSDIIAKPIFK